MRHSFAAPLAITGLAPGVVPPSPLGVLVAAARPLDGLAPSDGGTPARAVAVSAVAGGANGDGDLAERTEEAAVAGRNRRPGSPRGSTRGGLPAILRGATGYRSLLRRPRETAKSLPLGLRRSRRRGRCTPPLASPQFRDPARRTARPGASFRASGLRPPALQQAPRRRPSQRSVTLPDLHHPRWRPARARHRIQAGSHRR